MREKKREPEMTEKKADGNKVADPAECKRSAAGAYETEGSEFKPDTALKLASRERNTLRERERTRFH